MWLATFEVVSRRGGQYDRQPRISPLADAWAKGIRTFDPDKAREAY